MTDGEEETLHVIEGRPKDPALLAEAEKRKDLPVEPLLRITVGKDGFPRQVLVQCYCPRAEILELTVTDGACPPWRELNPDLPDDLFQFTPPVTEDAERSGADSVGVQIIEADPSMWK